MQTDIIANPTRASGTALRRRQGAAFGALQSRHGSSTSIASGISRPFPLPRRDVIRPLSPIIANSTPSTHHCPTSSLPGTTPAADRSFMPFSPFALTKYAKIRGSKF